MVADWFGVLKSHQVVVTQRLPKNQLGQEGLSSVLKAAVIGIPLPLCSCGVIPAALGLRKEGASKSATTAFMVATPETGVDSISVSYALLGPFLAVIRPIAAFFSAVVAGLLVGQGSDDGAPPPAAQASNCCQSNAASAQPLAGCKRASCCQIRCCRYDRRHQFLAAFRAVFCCYSANLCAT